MPRQPRIDLPGHLYHIIIRGIERRTIYQDKKDYQNFLDRVKEVIAERGGKCFAWALMPNHAHLLIRSGKYGLADMMRSLLTGYAVYFNIKHKRTGHLFQNRYKSILCDSDTYLLPLIRYINLNPVKSKIVSTIDELTEYPWTSHNFIMSQKVHSWYDKESILGLFGETERKAQTNYLVYLRDGMNENIDLEGGGLIRSKTLGEGMVLTKSVNPCQLSDEQILGDNDFITEVSSDRISDNTNQVKEEDEDKDKIIQDVIDEVTKKQKICKKILLNKNISRSAKTARALIVYIGVKKLGMTNEKIAKVLNITNPAVCKILTRNKEEFGTYEDKTIEMIIKN